MHKNIHFGFNWCVASNLCSTQINSKSSKSRMFVCYEPLLKFPEHQFLCSVSVRGPRASRAPSMLGSFTGLIQRPSQRTQSHVAIVIGMTKNHFAIFADAVSCALLGIYTFQKFS